MFRFRQPQFYSLLQSIHMVSFVCYRMCFQRVARFTLRSCLSIIDRYGTSLVCLDSLYAQRGANDKDLYTKCPIISGLIVCAETDMKLCTCHMQKKKRTGASGKDLASDAPPSNTRRKKRVQSCVSPHANVKTRSMLIFALRLVSFLLYRDALSLCSERMVSKYVSVISGSTYESWTKKKCSELLYMCVCIQYCHTQQLESTILRRINLLHRCATNCNKSFISHTNHTKLQTYVRGRLKRAIGGQINRFATDRSTLTYNVSRNSECVLPSVNYCYMAALLNKILFCIGKAPLHLLVSICTALDKGLWSVVKSTQCVRTMVLLELRRSLVQSVCSRLKSKLLCINPIGCYCNTKCTGWGNRGIQDILQRVMNANMSIRVCKECGLSPNTKNRKASRIQVMTDPTNLECTTCSLDGSPSLHDTCLYNCDVDMTTGKLFYTHLFHVTNASGVMDQLSGRKSSSPDMMVHGPCYGGSRTCMNIVKSKVMSTANMKDVDWSVFRYINWTGVYYGPCDKMQYVADITSFMCRKCSYLYILHKNGTKNKHTNMEEKPQFTHKSYSLLGEDPRDSGTCVQTLCNMISNIHALCESSSKKHVIHMDKLINYIKSNICNGCMVRLSCKHVQDNFVRYIDNVSKNELCLSKRVLLLHTVHQMIVTPVS